jgi:hypothetical protein
MDFEGTEDGRSEERMDLRLREMDREVSYNESVSAVKVHEEHMWFCLYE